MRFFLFFPKKIDIFQFFKICYFEFFDIFSKYVILIFFDIVREGHRSIRESHISISEGHRSIREVKLMKLIEQLEHMKLLELSKVVRRFRKCNKKFREGHRSIR